MVMSSYYGQGWLWYGNIFFTNVTIFSISNRIQFVKRLRDTWVFPEQYNNLITIFSINILNIPCFIFLVIKNNVCLILTILSDRQTLYETQNAYGCKIDPKLLSCTMETWTRTHSPKVNVCTNLWAIIFRFKTMG